MYFRTLFIIVVVLISTAANYAQAPQLVNYQGKINQGENPADGTFTMTFSIYSSESSVTPLYFETQAVDVRKGVFNVLLGSVNPFPADLFTSAGNRFLGIKVGTDAEMTPRFRLASVAFALNAAHADVAEVALSGGTGDGHSLDAADGDPVDAVFVDNNGNVGIGTASPAAKLHVALPPGGGTVQFISIGPVEMILKSGQLRSITNSFQILGRNVLNMPPTPVPITFGQSPNDFDMTIDTTGNVGIGTAEPTQKLHISGGGIQLDNGEDIFWRNALNTENVSVMELSGATMLIRGGGGTPTLRLDNVLGNPILTLLESGNVGIGTTNPTEKLHVVGDILANSFITSSSRELKENISDLSMQEAAIVLESLNPIKFNYKAEQQKDLHLGFIAEDVPDLVATSDRQGVSPMDVVAVLTKVVQEQQKIIAELNERVRVLESK